MCVCVNRYTFLREFLLEMTSIFPDPVLMLGGDEVGLILTLTLALNLNPNPKLNPNP